MKKIIYLLLIISELIAIVSCEKDVNKKRDIYNGKIILINGQDSYSETKTSIDGFSVNWIATEDTIGVYCEQAKLATGGEQGVTNFSMYAKTSAKSSPFEGNLFWGSEETHNFYSYYPYKSGLHPITSVPVDLSQYQTQIGTTNNHLGKLDFMIATPKTNISPGVQDELSTVDFSFNHLFTFLEFKIVLSDGTAKLGGIEMTSSSGSLSLNSASVDITQATPASGIPYTLTNVTASNKVSLSILGDCVLTNNIETTASAYMVVLPGDFSGTSNMEIKIMTNRGLMRVIKNGINFRRGAKYIVQITNPELVSTPSDLTSGPANCYMTETNQTYYIRGDIRGNGVQPVGEFAPTFTTSITPVSLKVIWESNRDVITSNPIINGSTICFATGSAYGNALIAAYDGVNGTGNILWSWHIWSIPGGPVFDDDSDNMMPYNLGAYNNIVGDFGSLGLLYQWGRKDPMPNAVGWGSNTELQTYGDNYSEIYTIEKTSQPGNILLAVQNPFSFITPAAINNSFDWYITLTGYNEQYYSNLWNSTSKSMFDPCPYGWKVPPSTVWLFNEEFWGNLLDYGSVYTPTGSWYPAAGQIDVTGLVGGSGDWGGYWTTDAPYEYDLKNRVVVMFSSGIKTNKYSVGRANAFSVRCVKE